MPTLTKGHASVRKPRKVLEATKELKLKCTQLASLGSNNALHGIPNTSGVLIRGEGMDREDIKKYILFSSQNILVTKACHPTPFSLTSL